LNPGVLTVAQIEISEAQRADPDLAPLIDYAHNQVFPFQKEGSERIIVFFSAWSPGADVLSNIKSSMSVVIKNSKSSVSGVVARRESESTCGDSFVFTFANMFWPLSD
jgi:hypothetical protein